MEQSAVLRWLEHAGLRANSEPHSGEEPTARGGHGKGSLVRPAGSNGMQGGSTCFVSVTRASRSSPGAASGRYHSIDPTTGAERAGVEVLRDDDIADWKGDRYSVVISPQKQGMDAVEMATLADHVLAQLEQRFARDGNDSVQGSAWLHHAEKSGGSRDHLHLAVNAFTRAGRPVLLTQRTMDKAVARALGQMEQTREMGRGR